MSDNRDRCGNKDCDACYPLSYWKVGTESVRRIMHMRLIKAATAEEALAIYNQGTEWPSSYDEVVLEELETKPTVVEQANPYASLEYHKKFVCFNSPFHPNSLDEFVSQSGQMPDELGDPDNNT